MVVELVFPCLPQDDLNWLRYWVVLAVVHMVELVVDPLLDFFPGRWWQHLLHLESGNVWHL